MFQNNKELQNRLQEDNYITKTTLICLLFKNYQNIDLDHCFLWKKSIDLNRDLRIVVI